MACLCGPSGRVSVSFGTRSAHTTQRRGKRQGAAGVVPIRLLLRPRTTNHRRRGTKQSNDQGRSEQQSSRAIVMPAEAIHMTTHARDERRTQPALATRPARRAPPWDWTVSGALVAHLGGSGCGMHVDRLVCAPRCDADMDMRMGDACEWHAAWAG